MIGRNDDDLWSVGLRLTSSNTSPQSHSATPATSRQSAASTKMRSELSLNAAHQNCSIADRRPLLQPNTHCKGRQEQYWHNCAPVTVASLVSTWGESTRLGATIATTVVFRLMTPNTSSTALRSLPYWQNNRYGLHRPNQRSTSTWRLMRLANNNVLTTVPER